MEEVRENKMGTQPIGDLLFKMLIHINSQKANKAAVKTEK